MNAFNLIALVLTLAALFSYVNHRFIKLPLGIGLMVIALVSSLLVILANHLGLQIAFAKEIVGRIQFDRTLMQGMLSFLLFAGALNVNVEKLIKYKWTVAIFTFFGVIVSTAVIAVFGWLIFNRVGTPLPFIDCLLFGALISPTDPVAVLALLKELRAPSAVEIKIAGEALFNDGLAIVIFITVAGAASGNRQVDIGSMGLLFLREAVGGVCLGLLLGWITYFLVKSIDQYQVEILLTLALVTGGYALANVLNTSGPLATVTAGILIGNRGRRLAMSETTRQQLNMFWELIDEIMNAVLFMLIGVEVLDLNFQYKYWLAIAVAVPVVLFARWISVLIPALVLRTGRSTPHLVMMMTWGGLRGGISVALALSLADNAHRNFIVTITYAIVVFSILAQGLTTPMLLRRVLKRPYRSAGHNQET